MKGIYVAIGAAALAALVWQTIVATLIWQAMDQPQRYQIAIAAGDLAEVDGTRRSGVMAYRVDTVTGAVSYCEVSGGQGAGKRPWPECLVAVDLEKSHPRDPLGLFQ